MIARSTRRRIIVAAAAAHLAIAALFSTHVFVEEMLPGALERFLRVYGDYTGAHSHFNFFAPSITPQFRARFVASTAGGRTRDLEIGSANGEVSFRLATMFNALQLPDASPALVRSWAAYLLARNPDVDSIEVVIEVLNIPRMAELRSGARASWVELARAKVRRENAAGR